MTTRPYRGVWPIAPLDAHTRATLLELARPLDPLALRWGR